MSQTVVGNLAVELGMSTEEFQRALAHAQVQAQAAANKIQSKINQAAASPQSAPASKSFFSPDGLLQLSRAVDDAQYGLRGVINNVEGVARGLGVGAGVAGMATMAAVAINALAPAIENAYDSTQRLFSGFQDGAERARMSVSGMMSSGFGEQALSAALRNQAEFLMNRTDATNFDLTPGFGDRGSGSAQTRYEAAIANNARRAIEASALMAQSFRAAADASKALAAAQRGASAQYDLTTNQLGITPVNRMLFQEAVDKFGGGDNLRTKLTSEARRGGMIKSDAEQLYGRFAAGEIPATNKVVELLGLQSERLKVMEQDYERVTGQAAELAHIEEQRARSAKETADFIESEFRWFHNAVRQDEERALEAAGRDFDRQMADFEAGERKKARILDRQYNEYESAVMRQDSLFSQRNSLLTNMNRSEIIGASDVFARNLNAGQKSPELTELEKINESIKELGTLTGILN